MKVNKDVAALSLLAGVETAGTFGNLCPPIPDIVQAGEQNDFAFCRRLRHAYVSSGLTSVLLAGIVSWIAESPWPFIASVAAAGVMTMNYERALPEHLRLGMVPSAPALPVGY